MTAPPLTPSDVLSPSPASLGHGPVISIATHTDGSPKFRLVDAGPPSPVHAKPPDSPRLELCEFQERMGVLAKEFFCARDVPGMMASIGALGCSSFHDELVAFLLRAALDRNEPERAAVAALLGALASEGSLSAAQVARGFEKLVLAWKDIRLDVPGAAGQLVAVLSSRVGDLDESFVARLPEDLLRTLADGLPPGPERESLEAHVGELAAFKAEAAARLEARLFCERSPGAFAAWLRASGKPALFHEAVLAACLGSFSASTSGAAAWMSWYDAQGLVAEKRDLALDMLAQLHGDEEGRLLGEVDLQLGFSRFLGQLGSHAFPGPCTQDHMVSMLRGALERGVLPAEFCKSALRMRFGGLPGVKVIQEVQRQTPKFSRREWGSGDIRQFRKEVQQTIAEYFDSRSAVELGRVVEELRLTEQERVKFVRKLLVAGMEHSEPVAALDGIEALLGRSWSKEVVRKAFEELRDTDSDLVLDFPQCRERTDDLFQAALGRSILEESDLMYDGITIV